YQKDIAGCLCNSDERRFSSSIRSDLPALVFEMGPACVERRPFRLQVAMNANDFLAGFGIGFNEMMRAGRNFPIQPSHLGPIPSGHRSSGSEPPSSQGRIISSAATPSASHTASLGTNNWASDRLWVQSQQPFAASFQRRAVAPAARPA